MTDADSDVADFVRRVMKESGLKQGELAAKTGLSQGTLSKWLNGASPNKTNWDRLIAWAAKNPRTQHLLEIDDLLRAAPPELRRQLHAQIIAAINSLPHRRD